MERLGERAGRAYLYLLASVFLLAAPFTASGGGYGHITAFKAALYTVLTVVFLLLSLPRLPVRSMLHRPWRLCALGYLLFSLISALCSPWKQTAFFGSGRREGFFVLLLYVLSFLLLSVRQVRSKWLLPVFGLSILMLDAFCLIQLDGRNPLGLYPAGMCWQDANIRYPGSYLGTTGNAGLCCAVLGAASALFFRSILVKGETRWLLLPVLLLSLRVVALADVAAPVLGFCAAALLSLLFCQPEVTMLCRWCSLSCVCLPMLLSLRLPARVLFPLLLLAWVFYILSRALPERSLKRLTPFGLTLALLLFCGGFVLHYDGYGITLREASELLHGSVSDSMGSGRIFIWRQVLRTVPEHLWLGTGPDTLGLRELEPYIWEAEAAGITVSSHIDAAHNEILHTLVCQGLPAALFHLSLFVCALIQFIRQRRSEAGVCAAGAVCYAAQAMFGISAAASAPLFWVLLALSLNPQFQGGLSYGAGPVIEYEN